MEDILRVLQKLPICFNATTNFAYIVPALLVSSKNFDLDSNHSDFVIELFCSSLHYFHMLLSPDFFE